MWTDTGEKKNTSDKIVATIRPIIVHSRERKKEGKRAAKLPSKNIFAASFVCRVKVPNRAFSIFYSAHFFVQEIQTTALGENGNKTHRWNTGRKVRSFFLSLFVVLGNRSRHCKWHVLSMMVVTDTGN